MTGVLVGGVSLLFQGDLDAGRIAVGRLEEEDLGRDVMVEDLSYGAIAVMHRLVDLHPEALVLVGAAERGRPPATVERRRLHDPGRSSEEVQTAVCGAYTGYVNIDLLVDVASGFGVLPPRTVAVEIEPVYSGPSTALTPQADAALEQMLELVRSEARRAPVLALADRLRESLADQRPGASGATDALRRLVEELDEVDERGAWRRTFAMRDRLREQIAAGKEPEGMSALDWSQWWALIEELDRLQPPESRISSEVSSNGGSSSSPRF